MSLFIVNFHWQTYSYNISFQAQRLERLRKERQNQIKCKNVQWKDRNTSYSGKNKRPSIFLLFLFLLLIVIAFSVHNFHFSFWSTGENADHCVACHSAALHNPWWVGGGTTDLPFLFTCNRALHIANKGKTEIRCLKPTWLVWNTWSGCSVSVQCKLLMQCWGFLL